MTKEELQEIRSIMREETSQQLNLMIENYFDPRFNLLAEEPRQRKAGGFG